MKRKPLKTARCLALLCCLMTVILLPAQQAVDSLCPMVRIQPERLPNLNIPRYSHATFLVNGELTVAGGHTSGFIPTPTAEYLKDGEWHVLQMVYIHDDGVCVPMSNGKVLLAASKKQLPPPNSPLGTEGGG